MEDLDSAARALRESEELHRITLINMSDAVFITDDDGAFTFICPNVDVIFGYQSDEVRALGRIARLLGRDVVDRRQLAAAGEIQNIEHEIVRKDGARRALLLHIKQVAIKGGTTLYACRDITERKQAEETIRRNEERLKMALEAASMGLWDWHVPTGEMNWSSETHRLLGDAARARVPSFDSFMERVDSADRDRVYQNMAEALERGESYETEFRVHGYDNVDRWVMGKGKAVRNGKPLRMIGVFVDFTDRYQIDRELRELGGRLINAHEQERGRLSRELHDDVAQRVGLLSVELAQLREQLPQASKEVTQQIATLSMQTREIGAELHRLSHELHPARLRHLGLEASIQGFCDELAEKRHLTITHDVAEIPRPIADDAALCLYRVTQEALHNVVKHSGATRASVTLVVNGNDVVLTVSDNGTGFDQRAAHAKDTLGLVSMRERARLLRGRFDLRSRLGEGTTVAVRIPVRESAPNDASR
jgi:PAS domain S-box-containing protein